MPEFLTTRGLQTTSQGVYERRRRRSRHQHADERQLSRLLRDHIERPDHLATKQRDELAALCMSGKQHSEGLPHPSECSDEGGFCLGLLSACVEEAELGGKIAHRV